MYLRTLSCTQNFKVLLLAYFTITPTHILNTHTQNLMQIKIYIPVRWNARIIWHDWRPKVSRILHFAKYFFFKSHAYFYDILIREKDKIPFSVRLFSCQIYVINKFAVMDDVLFTHIWTMMELICRSILSDLHIWSDKWYLSYLKLIE